MASTAVWISSPSFRGHRLYADQPSVTFLDDQLDEAGVCRNMAAHAARFERQRATVGLDAIVVRFRLAVAHGGDLRVGEHHCRHRGQIEGCVAAGHADGGTVLGGCRHVDELRLVGAVAGRVDVRARWCACLGR